MFGFDDLSLARQAEFDWLLREISRADAREPVRPQ